MTSILAYPLIFVLSCLGVWIIRHYAEKRQLLDHPNERSSHSTPTPRGGGLMIVLLVTGAGLWSVYEAGFDMLNLSNLYRGLIFVLCGLVIAWLGWRDDIHSLSPRLRFGVQSMVALISILSFGYFKSVTIPLFGELQLGVVGFVITFLWIVGMINAYNFMDGIDGMAGGVAFAGGIGWMFLSGNMQNHFAFWIALAVSASSLGFLFHNWSPAKIFMGDVASTFLGYSFAVLPLLSADEGGDALMLGTLLMWTFIMDAGVTFIQRLIRRENILSAHRSHLYQRLVTGGYPHSTVSFMFIILTFVAVRLTHAWAQGSAVAPILILLGLPAIWVVLSIHADRINHAE
ncbi:MAG: glycosyltransferase family 4 protein [Anaerolineaceae bacterium]|nr:MAG: glycosyltransferase family 4 protein [Anaerolineaceae bacterium]